MSLAICLITSILSGTDTSLYSLFTCTNAFLNCSFLVSIRVLCFFDFTFLCCYHYKRTYSTYRSGNHADSKT